jgi:cellulose synthase/poly-beta-1,6-N-acetylglucosamine synthase-like glycosyltransferase
LNLEPFVLPILYAVATAVMTMYGANLLWLSALFVRNDRLRPGPVPPVNEVPPLPRPAPAVTVQLPLYNEPMVVERLIDACAALDYPHALIDIQVLDDSTDETTAIAARRIAHWQQRGLDIALVHREAREGYKAGALKNGLRLARGEFIAIFDADFVPAPDFLRRLLPRFNAPDIGMVQARWGHINADDSLLTRIQAFGLDAHFALEQCARNRAGLFMNFNGTAGIWRRACIVDGGDWESDTLAEDLDLSYRAQLNGWRFKLADDVEVPSELPADLAALRTQQYRWTKGAAEAGFKLLGRLWRSSERLAVKVEGTFHLTAHFVFPFILAAALLHAPILVMERFGFDGPGPLYFAFLGIGLAGFFGFFLAQLFAQRALYPDWPRRLAFFPLFLAGSIGLTVNNTRALASALARSRSPFVRTPKGGVRPAGHPRFDPWGLVEAGLFAYSGAGLLAILADGEWAAVPFQVLFTLGFGLVTFFQLRTRGPNDVAVGTTARG